MSCGVGNSWKEKYKNHALRRRIGTHKESARTREETKKSTKKQKKHTQDAP
jgi:hypothetical protein